MKNAARMPLVSALHGTLGQGNTDPDLITLFNGWARLSTTPQGEMDGRPLQGFFLAGARLVSYYRLKLNEQSLIRTYSIQGAAHEWCGVFLAPGTLEQGWIGEGRVPSGSVELRILRQLHATWMERIRVKSHSSRPRTVSLSLELGCPIDDVEFEEEMKIENGRAPEWLVPQLEWSGELPSLRFMRDFGLRRNAPTSELAALLGKEAPREGDSVRRGVGIHFEREAGGPSVRFDVHSGKITRVQMDFCLDARQELDFAIRFLPILDGRELAPQAFRSFSALPRSESDQPAGVTQIRTGNPTLNQIIGQAQVDLELLRLNPIGPEAPERSGLDGFSAGIPRYIGVFGRDTVTTAWQAALFSPKYLEPALTLTEKLRGVRQVPWRDEENGRILHERRLNPRALLGESNREVYYGDVASTPFWIVTLAAAYNWTGNRELLKKHQNAFEIFAEWVQRRLNEGNGLMYYSPALDNVPGCNRNHAWKDSDDAMVDSQGRVRAPPLAAVEVQGYCYLALLSAAEISLALGRPLRARSFLKSAAALKARFNEAFWLPHERFFALALDRNGDPVDSIASNIGHCLGTGIIAREKLAAVVDGLISPRLFSGWGVRTLSTDNPAYDPFSYHRGSVWPVENATIAAGLRVCGFEKEALELIGSQFALATLFPNLRLPEVVSGHERNGDYPAPGLYPQANLLQSWSVSAISLHLQVILGIRPVAPLRLLLVSPALPEWLPWIELENLRVGGAMLHLRFWRDRAGRSRWKVLHQEGHLLVRERSVDQARLTARKAA